MSKNSLSIRLTEPVIFLRSATEQASSRRQRGRVGNDAPALLRGLLTLKLTKPARISSIEVILQGISQTQLPETNPAGQRRVDTNEENTFLNTSTFLFRSEEYRRSQTLGPGVSLASERAQQDPRNQPSSSTPVFDTVTPRGRPHRQTIPGFHRPPPTAPSSAQALSMDSDGQDTPTANSIRSRMEFPYLINNSEPFTTSPRTLIPPTLSSQHLPAERAKNPRRPSTASSVDSKLFRRPTRLSFSGLIRDVKELVSSRPSTAVNTTLPPAPPADTGKPTQEPEPKRGRSRGRSAIGRIGEAFGRDRPEGDEADSEIGWKEFHAGIYTYPIAFTIPSNLPPSLEADHGSVQYKLKAFVHRPGAFSSKFSASIPVVLIAAPAEEDAEEGDVVVVERQWDFQLQYFVSIGGRYFPQGTDIPWNIQLMPLSKMKLHRITFILEEKITYNVGDQQYMTSDAVKRFQLLCIRHPLSMSSNRAVARTSPPLLPIIEHEGNSAEAEMIPYSDPPSTIFDTDEERKSNALAHLLNPDGPWHLHGTLKVPQSWLHLSHKHALSYITVRHMLKIYLRVERGDDVAIDAKTGKRKLFDIIIETPINILSDYCRRDWASLPRYENLDPPPLTTLPDTPSDEGQDGVRPVRRDSSQSDIVDQVAPPPAANDSRPATPAAADAQNGAALAPWIGASGVDTRAQTSQQFARLVAGFEDEEGELPPTYASLIQGNNNVITLVQPVASSSRRKPGSRPQSASKDGRASSRSGKRTIASILF